MADHVIHISEAEAASKFADVLAQVRAGAEVVIESGEVPVAVLRAVGEEFRPRLLSESIALAKKHAEEQGCEPTLDPDFAADLEEIIKSRKPREISSWE
jgi:antitoxin (DNA-binding transcriptional repressor) of toxin-antitoxin stability system